VTNIPQIQYRNETVAGFEQKVSYFRASGVSEAVIKGNQATFLVASTGGAKAVTRGINGKIPGRRDSLTQYTCTLLELHDKAERTDFDIFASQGDGRRIMQEGTIKVMNREIDDLMIAELSTATNNTGTAATATLSLFTKAQAILGNNDVDIDEEDNMFCAISPAARNYLMQVKEFASADYVDVKPFNGPAVKMRRWMGVNFFTSKRLSGNGTNAEKLLMWHRNAIGWAANTGEMIVTSDYNKEDDYWFSHTKLYANAKLLQNSGVVVLNHDGSGF
jgi:hypothetical protein